MTAMCSNREKQIAKKKEACLLGQLLLTLVHLYAQCFPFHLFSSKNTMKRCYTCDKNEKFAPRSRFIINNISKHSRKKATPPVKSHVAGAGPRPQLSGIP
jgi:hypothetical protein